MRRILLIQSIVGVMPTGSRQNGPKDTARAAKRSKGPTLGHGPGRHCSFTVYGSSLRGLSALFSLLFLNFTVVRFYRIVIISVFLAWLVVPALPAVRAQVHLRAGYVVLPASDTVRGWLDDRGAMLNTQQCRFRRERERATTIYLPHELRAYGFTDGKIYETKAVSVNDKVTRSQFLECLVRGEASLYTLRDSADAEHYYLVPAAAAPVELVNRKTIVNVNGTNIEQGDRQYQKALSRAFQKCLAMQASLNHLRLSKNELVDVIHRYNECLGSSMTVGRAARLPNKLTLGVVGGAESSTIRIKGNQNSEELIAELPGKLSPAFGLAVRYEMPASSKSMSVRLELLYEAQRYEGEATSKGISGFGYQQQYRVATSYLRVPLLARYTYPRGVVRPFVEAGLGLSFALSISQQQRQRNTYFGAGNYSEWGPIAEKKPLGFEQSALGGFGLVLGGPAGRKLSVQVRGEYGSGFVEGDATVYLSVTRTYFLLAYDLTK